MEKIVYALKSITKDGSEQNAVLTINENKKITVDFDCYQRTIFLSLKQIKNRFSKAESFEKNICLKNLFIQRERRINEKLVEINRIDFSEFLPSFEEQRNVFFYCDRDAARAARDRDAARAARDRSAAVRLDGRCTLRHVFARFCIDNDFKPC